MQSYLQIADDVIQKEFTRKFAVFIPKDYIILDKVTSDFTKDGLNDIPLLVFIDSNADEDYFYSITY